MDIDTYLERLGYTGPREPTAETLRQLHRAHVLTVPFENLDIHLGRPIELSVPSLYAKIVRCRRGGFCCELNGLFGWLLGQLGFEVVILSARVFGGDQPGAEFDHLILLVELEEDLIADVGFGDSFLEPLWLHSDREEVQDGSSYRLRESGADRVLERRRHSEWEPKYILSLTPRQLPDFTAMCQYHQTSPESHFTWQAACSLATPNGRVTLAASCLITTTAESREERQVESEGEYRDVLKTRFGLELGEDARIQALMAQAAPSGVPGMPVPPPAACARGLILVYGAGCGLGKTTLSRSVAQALAKRGVAARFVEEHAVLEIPEFSAYVAQVQQGGADDSAALLECCVAYVRRLEEQLPVIAVMDSILPCWDWLASADCPPGEVHGFSSRLCSELRPLNPILVLVDGDLDEGLSRAIAARGEAWALGQAEQRTGARDPSAFRAYLQRLRDETEALLASWPYGLVRVATTGTDEKESVQAVLAALSA